jgi:hypothetical protein
MMEHSLYIEWANLAADKNACADLWVTLHDATFF